MTTPTSPLPDKSPDPISGAKSVEADQAIRQPSGRSFEAEMQKGGVLPKGVPETAAGSTPMDLARAATVLTGAPTVQTLMTQAKTAQDTLGTVAQQLNTPNLKFKRSQAHMLRNKLTDMQENVRAAATHLGIETSEMKPPTQGGALGRFLAYIDNGQEQFVAIQNKLSAMTEEGQQLDPAQMMLVQSKMNLASQEIEFSATLLSKVLSSITTIMGIQI